MLEHLQELMMTSWGKDKFSVAAKDVVDSVAAAAARVAQAARRSAAFIVRGR